MRYSINNFQRGQTTSPYTSDGAFWRSASLDIHGLPGMARINYAPTEVTGTSPSALSSIIVDFASSFGTGADLFLSEQGKPTKRILATAFTPSNIGATTFSSYHVRAWKGYVIATGTTTIRATKITGAMDQAWTSMAATTGSITNIEAHKMLKSSADDKLYICNGRYVGVLYENEEETFDPTDTDTFTFTADALRLPSNYQAQSLEDFGRFIAIFAAIEGQNKTAILLWDRATSDAIDASFMINEIKMTSTLERHGSIYITGGHLGNVFILTESGIRHYAQIKSNNNDNGETIEAGGGTSYVDLAWTSMAWWKDRLMLSVRGSSEIPTGIYSIKDGVVNQEFLPPQGSDTNIIPGSIISWDNHSYKGEYLLWGYRTLTPAGYYLAFLRDQNNRQQTGCYFETPLLRAGHKLKKNNIDRVEIILAKPLATGESITIKYRKNIEDSWTTLGTKSHTTDGAHSSYTLPGIKDIQNLQIRCEMETGASSKNTPLLQEITLF
jgi:hypothetical protein